MGLDVCPVLIVHDLPDGLAADSQLTCCGCHVLRRSPAKPNDHVFREPRIAVSATGARGRFPQADPVGVRSITLPCRPLKVADTVVGSVAVDVVHFSARRAGSQEGQCYESVDPLEADPILLTEQDLELLAAADEPPLSAMRTPRRPGASTHTTDRGHFIAGEMRHAAPLLNQHETTIARPR